MPPTDEYAPQWIHSRRLSEHHLRTLAAPYVSPGPEQAIFCLLEHGQPAARAELAGHDGRPYRRYSVAYRRSDAPAASHRTYICIEKLGGDREKGYRALSTVIEVSLRQPARVGRNEAVAKEVPPRARTRRLLQHFSPMSCSVQHVTIAWAR